VVPVTQGEGHLARRVDPDTQASDEPIVGSALAGNVNVFVTGDKAFLQLQSDEHLAIVSP